MMQVVNQQRVRRLEERCDSMAHVLGALSAALADVGGSANDQALVDIARDELVAWQTLRGELALPDRSPRSANLVPPGHPSFRP